MFTDFLGNLLREVVSEIPGNLSGIPHQEIPEKFSRMLLRKFLRNS